MPRKPKGNRQYENRKTGFGGLMARRKKMKVLLKKRLEKRENQRAAEENLEEARTNPL